MDNQNNGSNQPQVNFQQGNQFQQAQPQQQMQPQQNPQPQMAQPQQVNQPQNTEFKARNQRSLRSFIVANNSEFSAITRQKHNPDGTVTPVSFFTCGSVRGYISHKAISILKTFNEKDALDRLQYAEVLSNKGNYIPSIIPSVSDDSNVMTFGASLLRAE